ncbi:LETM1 domain-containing protein 1 [Galendromus occidentalis]|uniref:LETM1 domain-containing protein 1 n=1 Tax=Galendromus occidentalis TaxID=34638 RepID=A0AAJ7PB92_9ACAR|nr:LETM1 domain-containing protein 1 [Galendromus occidentalis]
MSESGEKTKYGTDYVKPRSKPRIYLARKFLAFVESYEGLMKKHAPKAFEVYSNLSTGTKLLYKEVQVYLNVSKRLNAGQPASSLTRKELEVYYRVPNDIVHVAPALVIAALPFTNYIIFPLLYLFPKKLLSPQYWTSRQLRYFEVARHLERVQYHDNVLWHFERGNISDADLKARSLEIVSLLRSGKQPSIEEILAIKPLFQDGGSFALHNLGYGHLRALSLSHGIRYGGIMPYGKSWRFGGYLWEMDRGLAKESIAQLQDDDLQQCCFMRGFNPVGLKRVEAEQYLDTWLRVSLELKDRELSLLLHSPILLAYNHKNNYGISFL